MREIARLVPINAGVVRERIHGNAIRAAVIREMSMRRDELARVVIIAEVPRESGATHADLEIFADLQMQMRIVESVCRAHGRDFLAAGYALAALDQHGLQMSVE